MAGSPPNLLTMDSRSACIQGVLKVKVKVKGRVIRALSWILGMSYSVIDGLVFDIKLALMTHKIIIVAFPIIKPLTVLMVTQTCYFLLKTEIFHEIFQMQKMFLHLYNATVNFTGWPLFWKTWKSQGIEKWSGKSQGK